MLIATWLTGITCDFASPCWLPLRISMEGGRLKLENGIELVLVTLSGMEEGRSFDPGKEPFENIR